MTTTWEDAHAGALGASEFPRCLHCAAARITGLPKTRPFSAAQQQRMTVGLHFQALERTRLTEEGHSWYPGQLTVIPGLAIPVRGTPDIILRDGDGKACEVREVKYATYLPSRPTREWSHQLGLYQVRYDLPGSFAGYNLDERVEWEQPEPPSDTIPLLTEWCSAIAGAVAGRYPASELPHDPFWCQRSEWACEDCFGQRQATELTPVEKARLQEFLHLRDALLPFVQSEKELRVAELAAKEIVAAHGGEIVDDSVRLTLRVSEFEQLDTKAIPADVRATLPTKPVRRRTLSVQEGNDAIGRLSEILQEKPNATS